MAIVRDLGGGFKEVGLALNCKPLENEDNSIIWHINRSYLGWEESNKSTSKSTAIIRKEAASQTY